jgi:hypothetical protein
MNQLIRLIEYIRLIPESKTIILIIPHDIFIVNILESIKNIVLGICAYLEEAITHRQQAIPYQTIRISPTSEAIVSFWLME